MSESFDKIPPEPKQPDWTIEIDCSIEGATATQSGPDTPQNHTHIERINPSWGTNGGWVPGTGVPHHYDAQEALARIEEAKAEIAQRAALAKPSASVARIDETEVNEAMEERAEARDK